MDSLPCPKGKKKPPQPYELIRLCTRHHAHSSETHLGRFKFSSPPVGINPVLSDVGALPRTVYKAWFYYFPPFDM